MFASSQMFQPPLMDTALFHADRNGVKYELQGNTPARRSGIPPLDAIDPKYKSEFRFLREAPTDVTIEVYIGGAWIRGERV